MTLEEDRKSGEADIPAAFSLLLRSMIHHSDTTPVTPLGARNLLMADRSGRSFP
jgi:hypothetical protein